jgi:hypothetical protein
MPGIQKYRLQSADLLRGGNDTAPRDIGVPMCNYFLGLLEKMGIEGVDQFGDSTGVFRDT